MASKAKIAVLKAKFEEKLNALSTEDAIFVTGILSRKNANHAFAESRSRAVMTGDSAQATRLLKKVKIQRVLELNKKIKLAQYNITPSRIIGVFTRIAFSRKASTKDHNRLRAAENLAKISGLYAIDQEEFQAMLARLIREGVRQFIDGNEAPKLVENQIADSPNSSGTDSAEGAAQGS